MNQNLAPAFQLIAKRLWLKIDDQFLLQLIERWNSLQAVVDIINQFDTSDIEIEDHISSVKNFTLVDDQNIEVLDQTVSLKTVKNKLQHNNLIRHKNEV